MDANQASAEPAELPPFVVDRPRLVAMLDEALAAGHVLVVGVPGSGKSVLLRQWAAGRDRATLISITGGDGDPAEVSATLAELVPAPSHRVPAAPGARPSPRGEPVPAPVPVRVVVIDDAHDLPSEAVAVLTRLADEAPSHVRLLLASRERPGAVADRLRVGTLTELSGIDLALSEHEAGRLLRRVAGVELGPGLVTQVHERTEGWAAAVQLVGVALRDRRMGDRRVGGRGGEARPELVGRFDGTTREVAEYLAEEVVSGLPPALQRFVRSTCVLDELEPSLCDALVGDPASQALLDELERRDLLRVVPAGDQVRYRYHPLLVEMLRAEMRGRDRQQHDELLARAARWYVDRGDPALAMELSLRAERWEQALDLIAAGRWTLLARSDAPSVIRWSERVPVAERGRNGMAQLALAGLHRSMGNVAVADLVIDEVARHSRPGTASWAGAEAMQASGIRWHRGPDEALAHARRALGLLGPEGADDADADADVDADAWAVGLARLAGGLALGYLRRDEEARAWIERAERCAPDHPPWRVRTLGACAALEALTGDLDRAERAGREALALEAEEGSFDPTAAGLAYQGLARVAYERGRLDDAAHLLDELQLRARACRSAVDVAILTAERARLCLAAGDVAGGRELLARWRREGDARPPDDVLGRLAAVEVQLLLAAGESSRARRTLAAGPQQGETLAAAAQLAAGAGDLALLHAVLDRWSSPARARERIARLLWEAVADHRSERPGEARARFLEAVALADVGGHVQVFLDGGSHLDELVVVQVAALAGASPAAGVLGDIARSALGAESSVEGSASSLSAREVEVLVHLSDALSNVEVAERLGISPNTLKTHLRRIYRKLGVTDRRGAVAQAVGFGLLPTDARRG